MPWDYRILSNKILEKRPYLKVFYISQSDNSNPIAIGITNPEKNQEYMWAILIRDQSWDIIEEQIKDYAEYGYSNKYCRKCNTQLNHDHLYKCILCGKFCVCSKCYIECLTKNNGEFKCMDCNEIMFTLNREELRIEIDKVKKKHNI